MKLLLVIFHLFLIQFIFSRLINTKNLKTVNSQEPLKIEVMIESLCPDCMNFLESSFKQYHNLPGNAFMATVSLIPFGNAQEKLVSSKWEFNCQHGENECYGNTIQACAIKKFDRKKSNDFLICSYNKINSFRSNFEQTTKHCLPSSNDHNTVLECAKNYEGNNFQHEFALKTPKEHTYVPWVLVNGVHNKETEKKVIDNLNKFICDYNNNHQIFQGCNSIDNKYSWEKFNMNNYDYTFVEKNCKNTFLNR
jgi:interferon gamma-inducible protein 30